MIRRKKIELLLVSFPILIIMISFIIIILKGHVNFEDIDFDKLGGFGGFIGGFIGTYLTLIATFYVYKTYHTQKEELKSQKKEIILQKHLIAQQQFESTFFNMLNVHRELKNNLSTTDRLFWFTDDQIRELNKFVSLNANNELFNEIVKDREKKGLNVFRNIRLDFNNLFDVNKVDNQIEFYNDKEALKSYSYIVFLKNKLIESKSEIHSFKINEEHLKDIQIAFKLIFEIYQDVISHYCRNVYHILKYIRENEENETLGNDFKKYKNYANIFQSQLNVDEQFLLFYNFIHFDKETDNEIFHTINLVNHYSFLENIGIGNLINKQHELFYDFVIKGSDRII